MVRRLLAAVIAAIALLTACAPNGQTPPEPSAPTPPQEPDGMVLTEEYVIVLPQKYDLYLERAAYVLQTALEQRTGVTVGMASAWAAPAEKEILLGNCDRDDVGDVQNTVVLREQRICFSYSDPAQLYCVAEAFVDACIAQGATDAQGRLLLTDETVARVAAEQNAYSGALRVLSQNLRYADDGGGNSVAERSERFAALVEQYCPDIIGTQEATPLWTQYLETLFAEDYGMIGAFRDGTAHAGDEANYILYRKDRFTVERSGTFWLTLDNPDEISKVDGALCNRVCTWAELRDLRTDELLLVCNTHLDHSNDDIRAEQMTALLDYLAMKMERCPTVLTGDFNMLRGSAPYQLVKDAGLLDGQSSAWVNDSRVDHTCHLYGDSGSLIDFCFYSKDYRPFYAKIIDDDFGGFVSDHYGVITVLCPGYRPSGS